MKNLKSFDQIYTEQDDGTKTALLLACREMLNTHKEAIEEIQDSLQGQVCDCQQRHSENLKKIEELQEAEEDLLQILKLQGKRINEQDKKLDFKCK